jgi:hypothetical protein
MKGTRKMKITLVIVALFISSVALAQRPSFSGHWQNTSGQRMFVYHKVTGMMELWLPMSNRQVSFGNGKVTMLSKEDVITKASLYELNAKSNDSIIVRHNNKVCKIANLSFSLLGLLHQSGRHGRNLELHGIGITSGTLICGQGKELWWSSSFSSWKRL